MRDQIKGKLRNVKGRVKQASGSLTGNRRLEAEGMVERGKGAVQEGFGEAKRAVGQATEEVGRRIKK